MIGGNAELSGPFFPAARTATDAKATQFDMGHANQGMRLSVSRLGSSQSMVLSISAISSL